MSDLRFDDRVAIVTGAGNGLGRSHALLLASRGAKVVVNDLGGGAHRRAASRRARPTRSSTEIKAAGGEAVANYDSVEDGDKIVQTRDRHVGKRIDIVVNNAGILRDTSFQKMTQEDWDLIYRSTSSARFRVTHAAWHHMRDAGLRPHHHHRVGRRHLRQLRPGELRDGEARPRTASRRRSRSRARSSNVLVNTIAPIAGSRMTETVLPQGAHRRAQARVRLAARRVALPRVAARRPAASSRSAAASSRKLRWERTDGQARSGSVAPITPEDVEARVERRSPTSSKATHPAERHRVDAADHRRTSRPAKSKGGNEFIDVDAALGYEFPPRRRRVRRARPRALRARRRRGAGSARREGAPATSTR